MDFKTILLPIEDSEEALRTCEAAASLAKLSGGCVLALYTFYPVPDYVKGWMPHDIDMDRKHADEAHDILAPYVKIVRDAGVEPEIIVREGESAETIIAVAEERDADIIVIGSKHDSDLPGLIIGSATRKVLHIVKRPVMVVR